jgi:predicted NAD-dependent protein-ADP-ribosyltransferase YbiA (DUF1768 family)
MLLIPLVPEGHWKDLSPDMPAPITARDQEWPTATQYFLAHRYLFDREQQEAIRRAATPDEARALARAPSRYEWKEGRMGTPEDPHCYWTGVRLNVLRRAIHERAVSDARFVERLLETSGRELTLDCDEPVLGRPEHGWARMLEEVRARLQAAGVDALRRWKLPAWMEHPEIPKGSIGWRMGYGEAYVYEHSDWQRTLAAQEKREYAAAYGRGWPKDAPARKRRR